MKTVMSYVCQLCNETFTRKFTLSEHIEAVHVKETEYICRLCGRSFFRKSHSLRCEASHKGFLCDFCGTHFKRKDSLNRHLKKVHPNTNDVEEREPIFVEIVPVLSEIVTNNPESISVDSKSQTDYKELYFKLMEENEKIRKEKEELRKEKEEVETILKSLFSKNQLALLSTNKKVKWTTEEIATAMTLRYLSRRAYSYIRQEMGIPLPGLSTLRRWSGSIKIRNGILKEVLVTMKVYGITKPLVEKLCVVCFDEMNMKEIVEHDEQPNQAIGPYPQTMQVVMARSLCFKSKPWKQVIFVDFDRKMTAAVLLDIIASLHDIGYPVVAVVSCLEVAKNDILTDLKIRVHCPTFSHPSTGDDIVLFPDVSRLLKLLRNRLLDEGFILKDGRIVNKSVLELLVPILASNEATAGHQITQKHLTCQESERQDVKLAGQLISKSVGSALIGYKPGDEKIAKATGDFIKLMSSWFDLFDISQTGSSSYGTLIAKQNRLLDDVYYVISTMRIPGKNCLEDFQKGIVMCTKGLPKLLGNVQSKYGMTRILTHCLSKGLLENLFSQLRSSWTPHDLSSATNVSQKLRFAVLGINRDSLQGNARVNAVDDSSEECDVLGELLRSLGVQSAITESSVEVVANSELVDSASEMES